MKPRLRAFVAVASAATALGVAAAVTIGLSPAGWPFVEGGPGAQDEAQLLAHRPQHNLLLMVADRSSDEAVPDVRVRISDDSHQPGLDRVLSGSWLLVNLPGGSYEIDLKHHGRLQRQPLSIGPDERAALVFYVDAAQPASD